MGPIIGVIFGGFLIYQMHSCDKKWDERIEKRRQVCVSKCGNHPYELYGDKCICDTGKVYR
jgi:hypothetical protein